MQNICNHEYMQFMLTTGMAPLNIQNHDTDRGLASVDVRVRQQHACHGSGPRMASSWPRSQRRRNAAGRVPRPRPLTQSAAGVVIAAAASPGYYRDERQLASHSGWRRAQSRAVRPRADHGYLVAWPSRRSLSRHKSKYAKHTMIMRHDICSLC